MFEILFLVIVGMLLGWFVVPAPGFVVALKNSLCREFPKVKAFLRKDVD